LLIIFDLDDTLIDTSKFITPTCLKKSLKTMIEKGLVIDNFEEQLNYLIEINRKSQSTSSTLKTFLTKNNFDLKYLEIGVNEVYFSDLPEDILVKEVKGATKILSYFNKNHFLCLVTGGSEKVQKQKLKKAGIDCSFFSKIVVSEIGTKKREYQKILKEFDISPEEVFVCGDRVFLDLQPAKELGCTTIFMKNGRGVNATLPDKNVDYVIHELAELKKIIP